MKTGKTPLSRLDQAAKAVQSVLAVREAAKSEERRALLLAWEASRESITGEEEDLEEEDFRLLVSVEEMIYQHELKHGPLAAVFIPEEDITLTPEEMTALPDAVLFSYCKGILQSGWKPNWKARAEWLASQNQAAEEQQSAGERQ